MCPACLLGGLLSGDRPAADEPGGTAHLEAGTMIGPFRIIGVLGVGGMATVYQAYDSSLERDVALKVLPPEYLHEESFARRFRQEARVIARLEHPNIVPIYASGIDQGIPWMSMRLLAGGSLGAAIGRGGSSLDQSVRVLRSVADALDYAHARGIIHRDIKPTNILLDHADHVCVADFGLAYMMDMGLPLTRSGSVAGTPQYMAPEQGLGKGVDHRCDIYSLGVVAFEMLTGSAPFTADSPVAVLLKHVNEPPPAVPPDVAPPGVIRAVQKALEKDPERRWSSAGEFVLALEKGLDAPWAPAAAQPKRRGRLAWAFGTAALVVAIVGALRYEAFQRPSMTPPSAAEQSPALPAVVQIESVPATAAPSPPAQKTETQVPVAPPDRPRANAGPSPGTASTAVPAIETVRAEEPPLASAPPSVDQPPPPAPAPPPPDAAPVVASAPVERPAAGNEPPAKPADVRTPPQRIRIVEAAYPAAAKALQIEGDVVLQVSVGVDGSVTAVTVLRPVHPLLDEAARAAVLQYRYRPGQHNGVSEASKVETTVRFVFK